MFEKIICFFKGHDWGSRLMKDNRVTWRPEPEEIKDYYSMEKKQIPYIECNRCGKITFVRPTKRGNITIERR